MKTNMILKFNRYQSMYFSLSLYGKIIADKGRFVYAKVTKNDKNGYNRF